MKKITTTILSVVFLIILIQSCSAEKTITQNQKHDAIKFLNETIENYPEYKTYITSLKDSLQDDTYTKYTAYTIGGLYMSTLNELDEQKALSWFEYSADNGNKAAEEYINILKNNNDHVHYIINSIFSNESQEVADELTSKLLTESSEDWLLIAELYLEKEYPIHAERWLIKSAKKGNIVAQSKLGGLYLYSNELYGECGVKQDDKKAEKWLLKAANDNNEYACTQLVYLYFKENGEVSQDLEKALFYLKKAIANGSEIPKTAIAFLENKINPQKSPTSNVEESRSHNDSNEALKKYAYLNFNIGLEIDHKAKLTLICPNGVVFSRSGSSSGSVSASHAENISGKYEFTYAITDYVDDGFMGLDSKPIRKSYSGPFSLNGMSESYDIEITDWGFGIDIRVYNH